MKRFSTLLVTALIIGTFAQASVGSCGAQVPVGTGTTGSVTLSSDCTELSASDFSGTTGYTISSPGKYCLTESFADTDATTALILIEADDVILDFKGHTISGGGSSVGITISGTRHNITIKNGTLRDFVTHGISIPDGITELTLENFNINNNSGDAITFAGSSFNTYLYNINITSDSTATGKGIEVNGAPQNFYLEKFSIDSLSGVGSHAIQFAAAGSNITLRNGYINDIGTGNTTDAINFTGSSSNVAIANITISNITGQGIDLANSNNARLKNIFISSVSAGSGIEVGDSAYDIAIENFNINDITANAALDGGIKFGTGAYAIALANGSISNVTGVTSANGLSFTGTSYAVALDEIAISNVQGRGIDFNSSEDIAAANISISSTTRDGVVVGVAGALEKNGFAFVNVSINNPTLTGITFNGRPNGIAIDGLSINGAGTDGLLFTNRTHGMISKNVKISNAGSDGIRATGIVENIVFDDFSISHPAQSGIDFEVTCTGITLKNGYIANPAAAKGIYIAPGSHAALIDNVTITDVGTGSSHDAISTGTLCHNITILNSKVSNVSGDAISIGNFSNGITLDNLKVSHIGANGLDFGTNIHNVYIDKTSLSYISGDGITVGDSSYGVNVKNCNLTLCKSDGIVFGNSCYKISINNFNISAHTTDGIRFGTGAHNIYIHYGSISSVNDLGQSIEFGTGAHHIFIRKMDIDRGASGILIASGADTVIIKDVSVSNFLGNNSSYGIKFEGGNSIAIARVSSTNCNNNTNDENNHAGVWFVNCSSVGCKNVFSLGHTGDEAYGFKIDTVNGGYFENCMAFNNTADSEDTPSADVPEAAVGFFIKDSTGLNFTQCIANDNTSTRYAYGFYLTGCSGNVFENCKALRNRASAEDVLATSAGFYSTAGIGNTWNNCIANGQIVNSATIGSTDGYGAYGFYLSNEQQSTLYKCSAKGNGLLTDHLANATGIFLDGTIGTDCRYCQVRDCEASANCTSNTTPTTAYGIRDTATNTSNVIINCMAYGNKDSASPPLTTNYYMDLPLGGTSKENWPVTTGNMDSLIEFANLPKLYNIDIE